MEKEPKNGIAKITLLRCEGDIGTIYRRLVQGNLKSVQPLQDAQNELFKQMKLKREDGKINGTILEDDPVSESERVSMTLAAKIISDPMQTVIPLFLLFLLPILFFSLI